MTRDVTRLSNLDKNDIGSFNSDISTSADSDTHVSLHQGWRIVHTVPDHRYFRLVLLLQRSDLRYLGGEVNVKDASYGQDQSIDINA